MLSRSERIVELARLSVSAVLSLLPENQKYWGKPECE